MTGGTAAPSPDFVITEIVYSPDSGELTLTWTSKPGKSYAVRFSSDMEAWPGDLDDGIPADDGPTTSRTFNLNSAVLGSESEIFFRVEETE